MSLLLDKAKVWRRKRLLRELRAGAGRLVFLGVPVLTAALWLDRLAVLPQSARAVLWLAGLAAVAAGAYVRLVRPWRSNSWRAVFEEAAKELPGMRDFLWPAWELREAAPAHTSPELARAHLEATEKLLESLPREPDFPRQPFRRFGWAAAAVVLCVLSWPALGRTAWLRVLAPWRDMPLERFLAILPADAVWALGQPAAITARLSGAAGGPAQAGETRLWLKTAGPWRAVDWDSRPADAAVFTVASVTEPLRYRLTWRSLRSRVYLLDPKPAPRLEDLRAKIAGRSSAVVLSGAEPLVARRGSWVRLTGRPNQLLAKAVLRASFLAAPVALDCAAGGDCAGGFLAQQDGTFTFELETPDGRKDPAPVSYGLRAAVDEPPTVELLSPQQPVQAAPASLLPLAYAARDDSGLSRVALLIRAPGQSERELTMRVFGREPVKDVIGDFPWTLAGLPVGAKVEFRVKAYDDGSPPQVGISQPGQVEIVDFEAGHRAAKELWDKAQNLLGALADREEGLRDRYSAGDSTGAEKGLAGLPQAWEEGSRAMRDLAQAMDADAYANPGLREQFSGLAGEIGAARSRDLPAAMEAGKSGDAAEAGARHGRLAELARRAQSQLASGRALQDMQDLYLRAGRLGQDGERLASDLESMSGAKKGQASGETMRRLQETLKNIRQSLAALQKAVAALPQSAPGDSMSGARRAMSMPLISAQTSADALQAALNSGDLSLAAAIARELAQQLAAVESAVTASAASSSAAQRQGSARFKRLQEQWSQVVEHQSRLVEATQGLEEARRGRFVARQEEMLAGLAAEEGALISSAAAAGAALQPQALAAMQALRDELASGRASRAPALAASASAALRAAAGFGEAQEAIGRKLAAVPGAPAAEGPRPETTAAAQGQAEVKAETARLSEEVAALAHDFGAPPAGTRESLKAAQGEQEAAQGDLARGDSGAALPRQAKALELLEHGRQSLGRAASAQQSFELSIGAGFSQPATGVRGSAGGRTGERLEFVPLPAAKDYQPPREIREELERSLREKRPEAYDALIKEYFKRLAQ